MHVNAAPNPRFKGHGSFDEMAVTGVITHMGDYFHSHYVDEMRAATAHLDSFGVAAGSTLLLPKQD